MLHMTDAADFQDGGRKPEVVFQQIFRISDVIFQIKLGYYLCLQFSKGQYSKI